MMVDLDVIWFQKPDLLFEAPGYKQTGTFNVVLFFAEAVTMSIPFNVITGALFFRDRFAPASEKYTDRYIDFISGELDIDLKSKEGVDFAYKMLKKYPDRFCSIIFTSR
jgi:hypothetical protein